ncbi:MAG: 4-hydroxybutyrate CoA-transferase [Acidimicrobiia bacterium]|nr:4-hydroxybutyrate CoA-transferase [Acidimicrobiia bacterium]
MEAAVAAVRPVDALGLPLGPGQPAAFLHALGERDDLDHLDVFTALCVDLYPLFMKPGVRYRSGFFGPAERVLVAAGADVEFVPSDFRRFAPILERLAPRVMATIATPPDDDGYLSLSLQSGATYWELKRCGADRDRVLVVEANAALPRTIGIEPDWPHRLHIDEVDVLVASDRPVFELPDAEASAADLAIAEHALEFIPEGATLQTGIGGIPSTVASLLAGGDRGGFGIHSEMFTTGLMRLHEAGKVTNTAKGVFDGVSVTTFAAGTAELYTWLDGNRDVRFLPVEVVNSPETISRNRDMVTINGALTVDLWGQVVADTRGDEQFSGIGGHEDFVSGAGLELDDRSLVCLPATAGDGDSRVSRIVAALPAGAVVTTPRHQLDVVITEFGAAHLRGRTVRERARAIAAIAHPDHRDELLAHAETMG